MSDKMDETKIIKLDDETVEQLVENRFSEKQSVKRRTSAHKPNKKKKRRRKTALHLLILALSSVLVFVMFFIGAYIFYTSAPADTSDQKENKTEEKANAPNIPSRDDTSFYGSDEVEKEEEDPGDIADAEEKDDAEDNIR